MEIPSNGWTHRYKCCIFGRCLTPFCQSLDRTPQNHADLKVSHMSKPIHVFIVSDNRLLIEGLGFLFTKQEGLTVLGEASNRHKALEQIKNCQPEVALIDIDMPNKDGIEVTQALHQNWPEVKVIILGMPNSTDEILTYIEAGAAGYALKEASFSYLVETIESANRGESYCSPQMAASLFSRVAELAGARMPNSAIKLTPREVEIINTIAEGLSNKEIAQRLFIEVQTVKNHVHNILDKLQLHNRLEAVQYARERNLLTK